MSLFFRGYGRVYGFSLLLSILFFLTRISSIHGADLYEIYGELTEYWQDENAATTGTTCLSGMELSSCTLRNTNSQYAPKLTKFDMTLTGVEMLCIQCCSHTPLRREEWELACDVDNRQKNEINVFEKEFRLLQNEYSGDPTVIVCPIHRAGCSYDPTTGELEGKCSGTSLYLTSMTMSLTVQEYHLWFDSWVVIKDCNVTLTESASFTGDIWYENYYIDIQAPNYIWTPLHTALSVILSFLGIYGLLRFFRRETCIVCSKPLVFARKGHRCFWCWYYDCDLPHPLVMKSLSTKGEILAYRGIFLLVYFVVVVFFAVFNIWFLDLIYRSKANH